MVKAYLSECRFYPTETVISLTSAGHWMKVSLYLIEVKPDQNHAKLCQYNVETGEPMGVLWRRNAPLNTLNRKTPSYFCRESHQVQYLSKPA